MLNCNNKFKNYLNSHPIPKTVNLVNKKIPKNQPFDERLIN